MAVLRLVNGHDVPVKLSMRDVTEVLAGGESSDAFVEVPAEDGPVMVRPSGVIAVIEDSRRGTAGFRIGSVASGSG